MTAEEKLSPRHRLLIGVMTLAMGGIGFAAGRTLLRPANTVLQPIQFNHLLHIQEVGLECADCHKYFATGQHSGLPTLADCMECHEGGMTDSPEEKKLLELARDAPMTPFLKLFMMPDHVYYSHRTHVTVAGLECASCHGDIAGTTTPPATPLMRITMNTCLDCHTRNGVSDDCTRCHN